MNNSQTILSSQSDNQELANISLIKKLKNLIKPDRETGKKAWEAGENLLQLQEQEDCESFEDLIAQELGLSKAQAERFIEIKKWIEKPDLITKNMAISHLEQVIRLKDHKVIETLLKDLAEIEKNTENDKIPYNEKIIGIVVSKYKQRCKKQPNNKKYAGLQLDLFGANNQESTKIDFEFKDFLIAEMSDYESQTKKDKDRDKWGRDIEADGFPEITHFYSQEPIDEQGLVGLFCTIFPIVKSKNLLIRDRDFLELLECNENNEELKFSKIKGIRECFPDAIIQCSIWNKRRKLEKTDDIYVEFEFESYNYVRHKHYKSKKRCELIVCWKHDEDQQKRWEKWMKDEDQFNRKLPFILSIEKLLEEGEINLINLNKL